MKLRWMFSLLLLAAAPVNAQWSWRYPQPQGHTLYDIVFLDNNTAVAVGVLGTVIVTHDAGDTWIVQSKVNGLLSALQAIDRLDDNTAVAVGDNGVILRSTDQGATWTSMSSGTSASLRNVSFFDSANGIVVAEFVALRTTNGGLTWLTSPAGYNFLDVDMTSSTTAAAVGYDNHIVYTTNGGETWTEGISPVPPFGNAPFMSVEFLDPMNGAIAAANGTDDGFTPGPSHCYVTADGGNTWTSSNLDFGITTREFHPGELLYPQSGEILVAGKICCYFGAFEPPPSGDFVSTVNAGVTWAHKGFGPPAYGLARNLDGVVIVVGENGRMIRRNLDASYTEFGGAGTSLQPTGTSSFLDSQVGVVFSSDGTNYMYGSNITAFSRTTDGGQTWLNSSASPTSCLDVACLSATEIVAVGIHYDQGSVLRSTNGGATWPQVWRGASPSELHAVAAASPTKAIAAGTGGTALIIDNGVVTPVATGGGNFSDIAFATPSVVLATGATDARSIDGGLTWTPIASPATGIYALDFVSATRAFGVDATGIHRTDNAGDTWTPVPGGGGNGLIDISFADANHGMVVGGNGLVLITIDGGTVWTPSETPTNRAFTAVSMVAPEHAFVTGLDRIVFEYGIAPVPTLISALDVTPRPFGADLRWEVTIDEHLAGFTIRRSSGSSTEMIAEGLAVTARSFRDEDLIPGRTYEYQLIAMDRDGSYTQSAPASVTIPKAIVELLPNQPNPFNPSTTIRFVVPEKMAVRLTVHDVAGRLVALILDDVREPGVHGISWNATGLASGVYFARLRADKAEVSRKIVLLR